MTFKTSLLLLFVGFFVWGCSGHRKPSPKQTDQKSPPIRLPDFSTIQTSDVFVYGCEDSLQFTAHVTQDSTWLFLPDTSLKVLRVESGSGARYEASSYLYWSKGSEAILQRPTGSFMTCQTIPREKSWVAARLRGVDFRALGQEPGWELNITEGQQIKYIGNYGQDTLAAAAPDPKITDGNESYHLQTGGRELTIEITDKPCTDAMSGFHFPSTVTITIDGKSYSGCGKALN